ncbi:hypothetical protein ODU73_000671 [Thermoclostridium stercorarium]|uniref:hypothetical protein n=1 Tax=Thermoclostridium stercorarium TaxID=1510 RepID=UPI00224935C3|nr:hypothetical protein [Thermoclostridium stercorarium]UZQ86253.1 hypothetical protein ODU73_000671 [Thermoclostridium stercorarium]
MIRRISKVLILVACLLILCSCKKQNNSFVVITDFDYFKDAGDIGFYKKGDLYGFIYLNGDTGDLEPFTLDKELSGIIDLDSIKYSNGIATFSTVPGEDGTVYYGFMDLQGNVVMKKEWGQISPFSSSGYASVYDNTLQKYVIIDKSGNIVRDRQSYVETYYPEPGIFICRDTFDTDHSHTDYYLLDKNLNIFLEGLEVYYESDENSAHTRQYTIFGDDKKFIYKKNNKYYIYDIKENKTVAEYNSYEELLESQKDFIYDCQYQYANKYEHQLATESYMDVYIHFDEKKALICLSTKTAKHCLSLIPT